MDTVNQNFVLSASIIALGYAIKRFRVLSLQDADALARIIMNVTLPALILLTFSRLELDASLIWLPVIGLVSGLVLSAGSLLWFRGAERSRRGLLGMALPGANMGLFAYPLVEGIWGAEGLKYLVLYDFGNALVIFFVCYLIGSYFSAGKEGLEMRRVLKSMLRSVPLMTCVVALIINLSGLALPYLVMEAAGVLSRANMPLALILLGMYLSFSLDSGHLRVLGQALLIRYLLSGGLGLTLFYLLPYDGLFRYVVLLAGLLPLSMSALPYTVHFDYDRKLAGALVNSTVVLSFGLAWMVFSVSALR